MAAKPAKWLNVAICDDCSADNFIKMMQKTDYIEDSSLLLSDIKETIKTHNPQVADNLYILHTVSEGTRHLAAAIVTDRKEIYGIVVCPQRNNFCLKRLGAVLEALIFITESMRPKLGSLKDSTEFERLIENALLPKGVSIFDCDVSAADKQENA